MESRFDRYLSENGRTYHSFQEGKYVLPNDEREQERLDLQHYLYTSTAENQLFISPLKRTQMRRVLDAGTGTGIWAMDVADEYPAAEVIAVDLSPIQPKWVPPNVHFQLFDVEDDWDFPRKFDLIYSRGLWISDWRRFFAQSIK
jgi:SAM-dependent methyltransferase